MFSGLNGFYHEIKLMNKTTCNLYLLWKIFIAHLVSKATSIHFIDRNDIYNYVGLIFNNIHSLLYAVVFRLMVLTMKV